MQAPPAVPFPTPTLERLATELLAAAGPQERSRLLLGYARRLAPLPDAARTDANRVMGCTAQVGVRSVPQPWLGCAEPTRRHKHAALRFQTLLRWPPPAGVGVC